MLLADLPEEILCFILDHLCPATGPSLEHESGGDLKRKSHRYGASQNVLNLILCSRHFHKLGMPCLYRSFQPSTKQSWLPFIRATLAQPDLAMYTKTLNFSMKPYSHFAHSFLLDSWPKETISWSSIEEDEKAMAICMNSRTIGYEARTIEAEESSQPDLQPDDSNGLPVDTSTNNTLVRPPPLTPKELRGFQKIRANAMAKWRKKQSIPETPPSPVRRPRTPLTPIQVIVYKCRSGSPKSTAIYLIYRLPNLESITLTLEPDTSRTGRPLVPIATLDPSLIDIPRLHSFRLNFFKNVFNSSKVNVYFPLLLQPSMRSFSASNLIEQDWHPTPRDVKLPLTQLSISKGNICNNSIDSWFRCCPQLVSFTYQQEHIWGTPSFSPDRLANSLKFLSQTLRELTIHRGELPVGCLPIDRLEFSNLGLVLRTFEVLRNLDLTTHLLLGPQEDPKSQWWIISQKHTEFPSQLLTECLPASLESLTLRDCAEGLLDESRELARCDMPQLKHINLHFLLPTTIPDGVRKYSSEEEVVRKVSVRSCRKISKSVRFEE